MSGAHKIILKEYDKLSENGRKNITNSISVLLSVLGSIRDGIFRRSKPGKYGH